MDYGKKLLKACSLLKEDIICSEMGGNLDKTDSFYPAYKQLGILEEKIRDDYDLDEDEN